MTAAARRGRRTRTKTDPVDSLEIARIAARDDDLPAPRFAGAPDDLAALVRYRRELVKSRTAALNRLHSTLEKIRCGYRSRTGPLTSRAGSTRRASSCAATPAHAPRSSAAASATNAASAARSTRWPNASPRCSATPPPASPASTASTASAR